MRPNSSGKIGRGKRLPHAGEFSGEFIADAIGSGAPDREIKGGTPDGYAIEQHRAQQSPLFIGDEPCAFRVNMPNASRVTSGQGLAFAAQASHEALTDPDTAGFGNAAPLGDLGGPEPLHEQRFDRLALR